MAEHGHRSRRVRHTAVLVAVAVVVSHAALCYASPGESSLAAVLRRHVVDFVSAPLAESSDGDSTGTTQVTSFVSRLPRPPRGWCKQAVYHPPAASSAAVWLATVAAGNLDDACGGGLGNVGNASTCAPPPVVRRTVWHHACLVKQLGLRRNGGATRPTASTRTQARQRARRFLELCDLRARVASAIPVGGTHPGLARQPAGAAGADVAACFAEAAADASAMQLAASGASGTLGPAVQLAQTWDYLGPFPTGKGEFDGDPVESFGGIRQVERRQGFFPSELATGGVVGWTKLKPDARGEVVVQPANVDWNGLVRSLSAMEVLEHQGWAVANVYVTAPSAHEGTAVGTVAVSAACAGVPSFYVGDSLVAGDQYRTGRVVTAMRLRAGVHTVRVRFRAKVQGSFSCHVRLALPARGGADAAIMAHAPALVPDVWWGRLPVAAYVAVPVTNGRAQGLRDVRVEVDGTVACSRNAASCPRLVGVQMTPGGPGSPVRLGAGQVTHLPVRVGLATSECRELWLGDINEAAAGPGVRELVALERCSKPLRVPRRQCPLKFRLRVSGALASAAAGAERVASAWVDGELRCRGPADTFLFTFLDHDGSVQQAAAAAPLPAAPSAAASGATHGLPRRVPVFLTQHGTGASAQSQADAYKAKYSASDKDYTFGVAGMWLLAPSRHGAHNWEGTGTLTATWALAALSEVVQGLLGLDRAEAALTTDTAAGLGGDTRRVMFAGHSMGGHGSLVAAVTHGDRALALVPLAGWLSKEQYGDANALLRADVAVSQIDVGTASVLAATVRENDVDAAASNVVGLPVLMRIGAQDATVHPYYSRRLHRVLHQLRGDALRGNSQWGVEQPLAADVGVVEVPDKQHWWWDTDVANDGGVVNDPALREFYARHIHRATTMSLLHPVPDDAPLPHDHSDGAGASGPRVSRRIVLTVANPATAPSRAGFSVLQQRLPYRLATVEVVSPHGFEAPATESTVWRVRTRNVRRLRFSAAPGSPIAPAALDVDGVLVRAPAGGWHSTDVCWGKSASAAAAWSACDLGADEYQRVERGPATYGPARQVAASPFLIVVGTQSGDASRIAALDQAATFLANTHNMAADTFTQVVTDVEVDAMSDAGEYNLIVLGGPDDNVWTARVASRTSGVPRAPACSLCVVTHPDVVFRTGSKSLTPFALGGTLYEQPGTGIVFTAPLWGSDRTPRMALVVAGTDMDGFRLAMQLAAPTIPPMTRAPFSNLVPDFTVLSPRAWAWGWAGVMAAGFWGNMWELPTSTPA